MGGGFSRGKMAMTLKFCQVITTTITLGNYQILSPVNLSDPYDNMPYIDL